MSEFRMPSLGSDMEAGTLVEQTIAAGADVHRGDVIGAVETQKGVIEIEVFQDGVLEAWLVDLGKTVPVGAPLAIIREPGEALPPPHPSRPVTEPPEAALKPPEPPEISAPAPEDAPPSRPETGAAPEGRRARITPAARRLAAARGIDPQSLVKNPNTVVTRRDVEAVEVAKPQDAATDFRAAIAAAMSRSKREIPHYYLSHDVDLTRAGAFVAETNAGRAPSERLLLGAVCAKAVAAALAKFPELNGHYIDGDFRHSDAVHLGFAINIRGGGLVAPALFNAEEQSLSDLMQSMRDLTARGRAGRFRARELSDATVTLTSLGERGSDAVFGVIYPPQVAIVGMGTPRHRPGVHDDQVVSRLMTTVTLAADHRVSDGYRGALFLRAIDAQLQKPEAL